MSERRDEIDWQTLADPASLPKRTRERWKRQHGADRMRSMLIDMITKEAVRTYRISMRRIEDSNRER